LLGRRAFLKLFGGSVFGLMTLGGYAFGYEPVIRLDVTHYALTPPGWAPGLKLRIVALADFHACEPWMTAERIGSICARANQLGGDIIVLLGDYTSGTDLITGRVDHRAWAAQLATLKAPLGVHAILGNHDWWHDAAAQRSGRGPTFSHRALTSVGIEVYSNRSARLEKDGRAFWLAGLEDQLALRRSIRWKRPFTQGLHDLRGTLAQITDEAPVILLAHEPDVFPDVPSRVSLTLSGHTHGGQVRVFGWSPYSPSRYGDRYVYGHIIEEERHIIVSGGLGCSIMPVRLGVPPEIVVIDVG